MIQIVEVTDRKTEKEFFDFPLKLYADCEYYMPCITAEEKDEFNPKKNGAFEYADAKRFLAYMDGKVVGRIAGIHNRAYNKKMNVSQLRFSRYDAIDDIEVTKALLAKLTEWARNLGANQIIGPIGFSDLDKQGLLVEGFDQYDMYVTVYSYPYYKENLEALGFTKLVDWVEYKIEIPEKIDERLINIAKRVQERYGYTYKTIKSYKEAKPFMFDALNNIMNEAYADLFGVVPLNERQIKRQMASLKMIFNPNFVFAVNFGDELVGYGFMAPSLNKALKKMNGKITLRGLLSFSQSQKIFDTIDLYSVGIKKEHQSKGVSAMILLRGMQNAQKYGVKYVETGPELENNDKVQSLWQNYNKTLHKRRRCYGKFIEQLKS